MKSLKSGFRYCIIILLKGGTGIVWICNGEVACIQIWYFQFEVLSLQPHKRQQAETSLAELVIQKNSCQSCGQRHHPPGLTAMQLVLTLKSSDKVIRNELGLTKEGEGGAGT